MKPSFRNSGLYLPTEFSMLNGLKVGEMILRDDKGRSWKIHLNKIGEKYFYLGPGFRAFWEANGLKVGGDYKFVLVENEKGKPPIMNISYLDQRKSPNNHMQVKETGSSRSTIQTSTSSTSYFSSTLKPYSSERLLLYLPVEFSIPNDLRTGEMILQDDKGRSWNVQLNKIGKNRFYLGRGFRDFWIANGLCEGDTYKFELVENEKDKPPVVNFLCLGRQSVKNHIQLQKTSSSIKKAVRSTQVQKKKCKPPVMKVKVDSTSSEIEDCPSYSGKLKSYYIEKSMLHLPSIFSEKNGLLNKEEMILKNIDERSWTVGIKRHRNYCYLGRGWKEYCAANGLKEGDLFKLELVSNGEIPVANFYVQKVHN